MEPFPSNCQVDLFLSQATSNLETSRGKGIALILFTEAAPTETWHLGGMGLISGPPRQRSIEQREGMKVLTPDRYFAIVLYSGQCALVSSP